MFDENIDYTQVNRAELIRFLSDAVKFCHGKATVGRLQAAEGDATRLSYMRALAQMSTPLLAALRDNELEAINKRLDEIEARQQGGGNE